MGIVDYLSLIILSLLWGAQILKRPFLVRHRKLTFLVSALILALALLWLTHLQFIAMAAAGVPAKYLIPPFTPLSSFLFSLWSRLYSRWMLSFLISTIFLVGVHLLKKSWTNRWFEADEPYLIATAILLIGHPQWLAYLITVIIAYLCAALIQTIRRGKHERVSLYKFWLPVAIAFVLLSPFIKQIPFFAALRIAA